MAIQRMDHVSVVVDDLEAAKAFFVELGMELEGEAPIEGPWVDRINGIDGVRVDIASKGGADDDPAWFTNLLAEPSVGVQAGTHRFTAHARVASPAEREPLWTRMAEIFPLYDDYAQKTDRTIPIVLLTPEPESGS